MSSESDEDKESRVSNATRTRGLIVLISVRERSDEDRREENPVVQR
jgi:hypothetical protein